MAKPAVATIVTRPAAAKPAPAPARTAAAKPAPAAAAAASAGNGTGASLMAKRLSSLKQRWAESKAAAKSKVGGQFEDLVTFSPGPHIARLVEAKSVQDGGGIILRFRGVTTDTEPGLSGGRYYDMTDPDRASWFFSDLARIGVAEEAIDALEPDQIEAFLKELEEARPAVKCAAKASPDGNYMNFYINRPADTDDEVPEAAVEAEEAPAEEAVVEEAAAEEEAPVEEEAPAEEEEPQDAIEAGMDVSYTDIKGKQQTGMVKQIKDDDTIDIKDDKTRKVVNVDASKVQAMAEVAE